MFEPFCLFLNVFNWPTCVTLLVEITIKFQPNNANSTSTRNKVANGFFNLLRQDYNYASKEALQVAATVILSLFQGHLSLL